MRTTFLLAALALAGSAIAQIPVPAFGSTFTSTLTRGFWFQAPANGIVAGLAVPNEALQPFQAVEFIDLGLVPPPAYPGTVVGTQLFYSNNTPGGSTIATAIPLVAGNYYGVLGACTSAVGSTTSYNSYGTPAGTFASTILGIPTTLTRFGTQFGIGAGGNQACWSEAAGAISRVDVTITPTGSGVLATNTSNGAGCISAYNSFYQFDGSATTAAASLSGNSLLLVPTASAYQGVWLPGTAATQFVAPVAPTPLATGDDGTVNYNIVSGPLATPQGPQTVVQVSGNGVVTWGAPLDFPGTNTYTPTAAGFLNSAPGGLYAWHDYNQAEAGSGQITAEEIAGTLYITFNNVESYANPEVANPSTLQFQLNLATGTVYMVFVSINSNSTSAFGSMHLIGYSSPGASQNPGPVSFATATAAQLSAVSPEVLPLALSGTSRPVTGTVWGLNVTNVPAAATFGLEVFGIGDPGINDLGFIGAPGCGIRASLDVLNAWVAAGGAPHAYGLSIPNDPALYNFHVFTTAVVLQPGINSLLGGVITANGIDGKIGNL